MGRTSTSYQPGAFASGQRAGVAARARIQRIRSGLTDRSLQLADVIGPDRTGDLARQADRLEIARLMLWVYGLGPVRVSSILGELHLMPTARVLELDGAHRRAIIAAVLTYAPPSWRAG